MSERAAPVGPTSSYRSALWVIAGLVAGVLVGIVASRSGTAWLLAIVRGVEPLGTMFVNAIRMAVVPLVVASLLRGIVSIGDERSLTRLGIRSLVVFVSLALAAAVLATLLAAPVLASLDIDPAVAEDQQRKDGGKETGGADKGERGMEREAAEPFGRLAP